MNTSDVAAASQTAAICVAVQRSYVIMKWLVDNFVILVLFIYRYSHGTREADMRLDLQYKLSK